MTRAAVSLLALLLVLTACTTAVPGVATPGEESRSSPAPRESPFPPRPRDLPLDGIDPCAVFTPAQLARLGINDPTSGGTVAAPDNIPSPACNWARFPEEPREAYGTLLITTQGTGYYLGPAGGAEAVQIAGYGAVRTTSPRALEGRNCLLLLDVAEGQTLGIAYQYEGSTEQVDTAAACVKAEAAAVLAVQTLSGR